MADGSHIEWTDATWNPTIGCSVISPGCTNCYAMKMAGRLEAMGQAVYRGHTIKTKAGYVWNGKVSASNHGQMIKPLSWKKPRRIFVNSMSDLFHEDMPEAVIDQVFAVMALCPWHTLQVLTKRAEKMRDYIGSRGDFMPIAEAAAEVLHQRREIDIRSVSRDRIHWPLPNVWLGVSVEDQQRADERIPHLLATPAAVRFLSCEPMLGPVDVRHIAPTDSGYYNTLTSSTGPNIDWVIAGGESGPHARPSHPDWYRALRDQCQAAGVPFFFKQWGEWIDADHWFDSFNRGAGRIVSIDSDIPWRPARPLNFGDAALLAQMTGRRCEHQSAGVTMIRAGKKAAGALLDGVAWREFPAHG